MKVLPVLLFLLLSHALGDSLRAALSHGLHASPPALEKTPAPSSIKTSETRRPTKEPRVANTKAPLPAKTTRPSEAPVPKKTTAPSVGKMSKAPVSAKTRVPSVGKTGRPTKEPVVAMGKTGRPTKEPVAAMGKTGRPTKEPVAAMGKTGRPTKEPVAAMGKTGRPTKEPVAAKTKRPSAEKTSRPTKETVAAKTSRPTKEPVAAKTERPTTESPSSELVVLGMSEIPLEETDAPTHSIAEETDAPTSEDALPVFIPNKDATDSPAAGDDSTDAPTSNQVMPVVIPNDHATDSPSAEDNSTDAPTSDHVLPVVIPNDHATNSPTESPLTSDEESTKLLLDDPFNETTASPTVQLNYTPQTMLNDTEGEITVSNSSGSTIRNIILTRLTSSVVSGNTNLSTNATWVERTKYQLSQVTRAGVVSYTQAMSVILELKRFCVSPSQNASGEILHNRAILESNALPLIKANREACEALILESKASQNVDLHQNLEYAATSCALVSGRLEILIDISGRVATYNGTCAELIKESMMDYYQYDTEIDTNYRTVGQIVLACVGGAIGLVMMVLPPIHNGDGSKTLLVLSFGYASGYVAFTLAWYLFDMQSFSSWQTSAWWKDFYASYVIGLAGFIVGLAVVVLLYVVMLANPWLLGIFAGFAVGVVFGIELNTLGFWRLGFAHGFPSYVALACSMACGAFLFIVVFAIWSGLAPTKGLIQHFAGCWIGSYLFIKMIGVIVGNYPNEFDLTMENANNWETMVYIVFMIFLGIISYVTVVFVYGLATPVPKTVAAGKGRKRDDTSSTSTVADEKEPLLTSNSKVRRRKMGGGSVEDDTMEFGGVRSLKGGLYY